MIALTSPIETPWHRLPAGPKLALLCAVTLGLVLTGSLSVQLGALAAVAGLYLLPGRDFARAGLWALRPLIPFLVVIFLWHWFTETALQGAGIAARLLAAVGLANLVTMTTRLDDMIGVLRRVLAPLRRLGLRTGALEIAIAMVIRFIPVLAIKGRALTEAWRARAKGRPGWRVVAPFTLLAIDDAEHVAEALRARGGVPR
ncbi:ABC transporter permease [Maritimibacter sp. 55A14]|uniref:energy-coupling factor transporter transmembrane component T family protein n=1 Tax=Maritimibacter sp. 55A14 TaxID=2174844 RepID=UPI000D60D142|nr:energy-coupling factor transporter transmembrane component T [Maritimibacter sp. 55A14]PWE33772.1 ABC transporter permease [Maritimibacter sp. 55A14]